MITEGFRTQNNLGEDPGVEVLHGCKTDRFGFWL